MTSRPSKSTSPRVAGASRKITRPAVVFRSRIHRPTQRFAAPDLKVDAVDGFNIGDMTRENARMNRKILGQIAHDDQIVDRRLRTASVDLNGHYADNSCGVWATASSATRGTFSAVIGFCPSARSSYR